MPGREDAMAKVKVPAKVVDVCDLCRRETRALTECDVCGRSYCLTCDAIVMGCMIQLRACRDCGKRDDVKAVVERYAKKFRPIYRQRTAALKRLRKKAKK
jgi:hypothetical protein